MPLFLKAVPQKAGMMERLMQPLRMPRMISSLERVPSSKYLFISSSSCSAAASIISWRISSHFSLSSAGISE